MTQFLIPGLPPLEIVYLFGVITLINDIQKVSHNLKAIVTWHPFQLNTGSLAIEFSICNEIVFLIIYCWCIGFLADVSLQFTLQKQLQAMMLRVGDSKFDNMGKDKDLLRWVLYTMKRR